jgi:hypothetical protein
MDMEMVGGDPVGRLLSLLGSFMDLWIQSRKLNVEPGIMEGKD